MKHLAWLILLTVAVAATVADGAGKKKKDREDSEQTEKLEVLKNPPPYVVAETDRITFRVTPLTARGLLSQQVRDSLKWLLRESHGQVLKIRAFVAGSGDVRRVQTIVSELFTERRLPLPAVTVVQAGALPLDGAQVVIESTELERKPVNPNGLAFAAAQPVIVDEPLKPVAALAAKSAAMLDSALRSAAIDSKDVLRATCFLTTLSDIDEVRKEIVPRFPSAAFNFVQVQRAPLKSMAACEAVARVPSPQEEAVRYTNGGSAAPQVISIKAPRLAITSSQMSFGSRPEDARLAFERLGKVLDQAGTSFDNVVAASVYSLSSNMAEAITKAGADFYKGPHRRVCSIIPFEGLPSMDAAFSMDVVAVIPDSK